MHDASGHEHREGQRDRRQPRAAPDGDQDGAEELSADRQRQALVLKQYQDLSYQEIADAMDTSVSSVQMLLHRAMTALRKKL